MPCATVHILAAERVLAGWRKAPRRAPIDPARPAEVDAFRHGALAPDMGFVPGVDRLVSEVAHYVRPGDLARNLVAAARSREDAAFAWGWSHHALVDVEIHPLVGRAVGERLYGDRSRRVDALEDVATHVSLEVGLDVALFRTADGGAHPLARPFLGGRSARTLARALAETYDVEWDPSRLVRDHRRAVGLTRWWPRALSLLVLWPAGGGIAGGGARGGGAPAGGARGGRLRRPVFGWIAGLAGSGSPARGLFAPEEPRAWFLEAVRDRIHATTELFGEWVEGGMEHIGNPNLETGGPAGPDRGHPATERAYRKLGALRQSRKGEPVVRAR